MWGCHGPTVAAAAPDPKAKDRSIQANRCTHALKGGMSPCDTKFEWRSLGVRDRKPGIFPRNHPTYDHIVASPSACRGSPGVVAVAGFRENLTHNDRVARIPRVLLSL